MALDQEKDMLEQHNNKKNAKYRDQFSVFYTPLFFEIIDAHHRSTYKKTLNKSASESRLKFINFLDRNHEHCVISNQEIEIENYGNKDAKVSLANRNTFNSDIENCLTTNKTNTTGFIYLHDKNLEDHGKHQNTFIISPTKQEFWRLEPNFAMDWQENSVKKQFCKDNLKEGQYDLDMYEQKGSNIEEICKDPNIPATVAGMSLKDFCTKKNKKYYDFPNKALNDYFKDFPLKIKGKTYKFSGYYPYALNTCPNHGGLCAVISTLQSQISRVLQPRDIKFYLMNFFKDQLHEIYHLNYDININTNNKLTQLLYFLKKDYGQNNTIYKIDGKNYTNDKINSLTLTNTVNKIEITDSKLGYLKFEKPKSEYFLTIKDYENKYKNDNSKNEQCKNLNFGKNKFKLNYFKFKKLKSDLKKVKNKIILNVKNE